MSDINPYAAPRVPDPVLPDRPPPGGAWRDGRLLVVHRLGGALPHICLLTGQPADVRLPVHIHWSYPIDYSMRNTLVEIGLTTGASRKNVRNSNAGCAANGVSVVGMITLIVIRGQLSRPLFWVLLAPLILSAVIGMIVSHYSNLLRFAKARGEYIWLRGADVRFLDQLPLWPGPR